MIKQRIMLTEILEVKYIRYMRSHNSGSIHSENFLFDWSNEKNHFSKTKMYFHKKKNKNKTTPQLLGHIGLQNMKVRVKANFGWLAAVCLTHADISS